MKALGRGRLAHLPSAAIRSPVRQQDSGFTSTLQFIDFGGEDEIAFGEAVDLVGPRGDYGFAPAEQNVWMMALRFGDFAHFNHKGERLNKIRELECARNVVAVNHFPLRDLL